MNVWGPTRARRCAALLVVATAVAACGGKSDNSITSPTASKPCGSGGTVQLSSLQAATISCLGGTDVTLAGGGASYLVVPQFATENAANRLVPYSIGLA